MLRVAIVSDWCAPRRGGIETHIFDLAAHLPQLGIDATIVTPLPGPERLGGVPVERIATTLLPGASIAISPLLVQSLVRRLSASSYDLVHAHPSLVAPFCVAAMMAAERLGIPALATFHSTMQVTASLMAWTRRLTGWPSRMTHLSAVSGFVAQQIRTAMPGATVDVLPNGFDESFWPVGKREEHRSARQTNFVSALRLEPRKRPDALLRNFARALQMPGMKDRELSLTIAGDGSLRRRLENHVHSLGLHRRVTFAGWMDRERLRDLYAQSSAFLMASTSESFCIAALEARAAGLPVIGMARTGLTEFVRHGENGMLAADDSDMARQIAALTLEADLRDRLALNAVGLERHEWGQLAAEHADLYRRLVAAAAQSRT